MNSDMHWLTCIEAAESRERRYLWAAFAMWGIVLAEVIFILWLAGR